MKELPNLELANESFWLWPPVADAVQTFLRRREYAADYERLWRLIHIWESIATTLSNVAVAALISERAAAEILKVRECLYGLTWDKIADVIKSKGQGALDGSNDQRIEILNVVQKSELPFSGFLGELKQFLVIAEVKEGGSDSHGDSFRHEMQEFSRAWRRVCDVPSNLDRASSQSEFTVYDCFKVMNIFRNRFAHVPFPFDPLKDLVESVEGLTELLFSTRPLPARDVDKQCGDRSSALTGCLIKGKDQWRGAMVFKNRDSISEGLEFGFPARKTEKRWSARPFVHVDVSKRSYVLTRLKDEETGTFEYTRFWAEGDAILTADDPEAVALIPRPTESDYRTVAIENAGEHLDVSSGATAEDRVSDDTQDSSQSPQHGPPTQLEPAKTYSEALEAIRQSNFDAAIPFLQRDVKNRPNYHNAWLKLGFALREKAGREIVDRTEALGLLDEAKESFTKALGHIDPGYRATAYYDRSKVSLRKYQLTDEPNFGLDAWRDAIEAAKLDTDYKFQSWIEYLERILPNWIRGKEKIDS